MPVRCVIVDDNAGFLDAASSLLEQAGISVVGTASTGAQACRACRELQLASSLSMSTLMTRPARCRWRASARLQVSQHREDAAVVVLGLREPHPRQDAADMLFHGSLGDPQPVRNASV
jgi:DNA-binding NarL/FixJ family response regulator